MIRDNMPKDIADALDANPAAKEKWESLPPSHTREYLTWIEGAKKETTRQGRIQKMIDMLVGRGKE
ncbi:MAG TPA: YdeI/OmpD-associated family protein [Burkholderiaceae bacterium]|nr:YdeI/OmpD-associated family protein [Burkholderiaceae bacterium]